MAQNCACEDVSGKVMVLINCETPDNLVVTHLVTLSFNLDDITLTRVAGLRNGKPFSYNIALNKYIITSSSLAERVTLLCSS
jgi:hypothetical protein